MSIGSASGGAGFNLASVISGYSGLELDNESFEKARRGTFELNAAEFGGIVANDVTEGFSAKWYEQYKAILQLKAEQLQQKLTRSYVQLLEDSMGAKINPDNTDTLRPEANMTDNRLYGGVQTINGIYSLTPPAGQPRPNTNPISKLQELFLRNDLDDPSAVTFQGTAYTPIYIYRNGPMVTNVTTDDDDDGTKIGQMVPNPLGGPNINADPNGIHPCNTDDDVFSDGQRFQAVLDAVNDFMSNDWSDADPEITRDQIVKIAANVCKGMIDSATRLQVIKDVESGRDKQGNLLDGVNLSDLPLNYPPDAIRDSVYSALRQTNDQYKEGVGGIISPALPDNSDDVGDQYDDTTQLRKIILPAGVGQEAPDDQWDPNNPDDLSAYLDPSLPERSINTFTDLLNTVGKSFAGRSYDDIDGAESVLAKTECLQVDFTIIPLIPDWDGGAQAPNIFDTSPSTSPTNLNPLTHTSAINDAIGFLDFSPYLEEMGIPGVITDLLDGLPILPNMGVLGVSIPINIFGFTFTIITNVSFDFLSYTMANFLNSIRTAACETLEAFSYSTTQGTAMDSYVARGEYQYTTESIDKALGALGPLGDGLNGVFGLLGNLGPADDQVNGVTVKDKMFGQGPMVNVPEKRELETGGFFSTVEFLRQFNVDNMDYSYYTQTSQREEVINGDMLRALAVAGPEIFHKLVEISTIAIRSIPLYGWIIDLVIQLLLTLPFIKDAARNLIQTVMFQDQEGDGDGLAWWPMIQFVESKFESESFDFLEDETLPFESDSTRTRPAGFGGFDPYLGESAQLVDGFTYARRFKDSGLDTQAGRTNSKEGLYQDTALGDINEVTVRSKTVSLTGSTTGVTVNSAVTNEDHYIGSDQRLVGRRYDMASAVNHNEFITNWATGDKDTRKRVRRANLYELNATMGTGGDSFNLKGDRALNPMFGGRAKMARVGTNTHDDVMFGGAVDANSQALGTNGARLNPLNKTLYDYMHVHQDGSNIQKVKEYRDVFNTGLMKHVFLTAQANCPTGGGITSNIEISFDVSKGSQSVQQTALAGGAASSYNAATDTWTYDQSQIQKRYFKNAGQGEAEILLNSYVAFRKRAK